MHRRRALSPLLICVACATPEREPVAPDPVSAAALDTPYTEQDEATRNARARMVGYFPNTELVTHENETVRFYDDLVVGKCVVVNFMYTVCDGI